MKPEHIRELNDIVGFIDTLYDNQADHRLIHQFPVDMSIVFDDEFVMKDYPEWLDYIRSHIKNKSYLRQTWLNTNHSFCFFVASRDMVNTLESNVTKKVMSTPIDEEEKKTSSFDYSIIIEKIKSFIDKNKAIKGSNYEPFGITMNFPYGETGIKGFDDDDFVKALTEAGFNVDRAFLFDDGSAIRVEIHTTAENFIRHLDEEVQEMYNRNECPDEKTSYNFGYPAYLDNDLRDLCKSVFSHPDYIKDLTVDRENHNVVMHFNNPYEIKKEEFINSQCVAIAHILDSGETYIKISVSQDHVEDMFDVIKKYLYRLKSVTYADHSTTFVLKFHPDDNEEDND